MNRLDVINKALTKVGATKLISESSINSEAGRLASDGLNQAVKDVLIIHAWNCAKEDIELFPDLTAPPSIKYIYTYIIPSDVLYFQYEHDGNPFEKMGRRLFSDSETLKFRVVKNKLVEDLDDFVANLIAARLAADITIRITGSAEYLTANETDFARKYAKAKMLDQMESPENVPEKTTLWTSEFE